MTSTARPPGKCNARPDAPPPTRREDPRYGEAPDALTALMIEYQGGSMDAFTTLYGEMAPKLKPFVAVFVRDCSVAEDLVQETFLQIHRARHTYTPPRPVRPWAYAIARHVALMHLRSKKKRQAREFLWDFESAPFATRPEGDAVPDRLTLHRALSVLNRDHGIAVYLHHVLGFRFNEIGEIMGISESAAKVRSHRALKKLRTALQAQPAT